MRYGSVSLLRSLFGKMIGVKMIFWCVAWVFRQNDWRQNDFLVRSVLREGRKIEG